LEKLWFSPKKRYQVWFKFLLGFVRENPRRICEKAKRIRRRGGGAAVMPAGAREYANNGQVASFYVTQRKKRTVRLEFKLMPQRRRKGKK